MEKNSSEWQLQGQPTVLLTLAHIFHRFAPLLVRGRQGGGEAQHGSVHACARGWEAEVREAPHHHLASRMSPRVGGDASSQGYQGMS